MRFMVIVRSTGESEAGVLPDEKILPTWGTSTKTLSKLR